MVITFIQLLDRFHGGRQIGIDNPPFAAAFLVDPLVSRLFDLFQIGIPVLRPIFFGWCLVGPNNPETDIL